MGLGDFLSAPGEAVNSWLDRMAETSQGPNLATSMGVGAAVGKAQADTTTPGGASFFKQAAFAGQGAAGAAVAPVGVAFQPVDTAVRSLPFGVGNLIMDAPSRTWDTLFITAAHADSVGRRNGSQLDQWGAFLSPQTWSKAWNNWGSESHVSAGQIWTGRAFGADEDGILVRDPLAAADAQAIQNAASDTWYGEMAAGATDLAASMVLPGAGIAVGAVKAARAGKAINSGVEAEQIAQRFAETGGEGASVNKVGAFKDALLDRPQNPDTLIGRMVETMNKSDGYFDHDSMMAYLDPMMENSTPAAKVALADVLVQANKVEDPALRSQVKVNAMLAVHGSATAREALIRDFPLLAKNLENQTGAPRDIALAEDLLDARLSGASNDTVNGILERHYSRPGDAAELDALRDAVDKAQVDAKDARALWQEIRAEKPTIKNFDADRLRETRSQANVRVHRLQEELKAARKELKGNKRWAGASVKNGEKIDIADFNASMGDARTRVAELEQRLFEAKSDRDLFHSTPLPGFEELGTWRQDVGAAKGMVDEARANTDWAVATRRNQAEMMRLKKADLEKHRPGLNRANDFLNEIFSLGEDGVTATGRVAPTALDTVKTKLRLMAGDEHTMRFGDANTPVVVKTLANKAARAALTPQARGAISLIDTDLGQRQLADALKRSKTYTIGEIKAAQRELIITPAAKRQTVIAKHQEQMLERIALKYFGDGRTPEEALAHAKEITQAGIRSWGEGNEWVTRHANEQKGKGKVIYRTPDGQAVMIDEAMLAPHLADNAPLLDPEVFENAIKADLSHLQKAKQGFVQFNDAAVSLWKHGALLRPGLAVRAALDTEMRALALMSTAETFMAATNGAANILRNRRSAVSRVLMGDGDVAQGAVKRLSMDMTPVRVDLGDGRTFESAFARTADERTANQTAMTKGADSPWKFYMTETQKHLSRFRADRAKWGRYKADSPHWVSSYVEYAEVLLASPTARWLAKNRDETVDLNKLMDSTEFKNEFAKVAQPKGFTRWEFARQVMHEVDTMFPDGDLVDAVQSHRLTPKMVEDRFPRQSRFDVPGPEQSVISTGFADKANRVLGNMYRQLLDKPDMWLSRNPTGTMLYRRALQREADAIAKAYPEGDIPPRLLEVMERRARTEAISQVRRTFFDTTRHTAMHEKAARISPFFAAWEDAMISWTRLIHDDPRRLVKLSAAYNAAGTLNPYLPQPLLVDRDGKPIRRGQKHDGAYLAVPFKVKGVQMRVRLEALNSIAQGETWWLPGFGPQATIATSQVLTRFLPKEIALDIVGSDHPIGKQVLQSMFLDGELPKTDVNSTFASVLPSTLRNLHRDIWGDNFAMNVQRNANDQIAKAQKQGKRLNDSELNKIYDRAAKTAYVAATVRAISGGGFGMTGTAVVDGQFYVEQMRTIEAMPPAQLMGMGFSSPEEYFAHLHPEAADLDWHVSKNETGIRASVNAEKASSKLAGVLKDHPGDIGWMVLGRENMNVEGGDDFSSTSYNMQASSGARVKQDAEQIEAEGRAAVGWKKYRNMRAELDTLAEEMGLDPKDPLLGEVRRDYTAMLMENNAAWAKEWSVREDRFGYNYSQAVALSKDNRIKSRSDMVAFRDYDEARGEVMDTFGLASLSGTGPESLAAKDTLREVGETLAKKDFGFQQMWDRFLSQEVEEG